MKLLNNKAQATVVMGLLQVGLVLFVGALIMQEMTTSFGSKFTADGYEGVYNDTNDNTKTAFSLSTLAPIIMGAGGLLSLVLAFTRAA